MLVGCVHATVHLLAPPGARIQPDEPDRDRACWRYAVWEEDADIGPPMISIDRPDSVVDMGSAEVVDLLPNEMHDFVRVELARQFCRAVTFGKAPEGGRPLDRHALLAGRTLGWTSGELTRAFPDEHWFTLEAPVVRIPSTVDELLERIPAGDDGQEPRPRRWGKIVSARRRLQIFQLKAEYETFSGLASALRKVGRDGGATERLSRKLDRRILGDRYGLFWGQSELTR